MKNVFRIILILFLCSATAWSGSEYNSIFFDSILPSRLESVIQLSKLTRTNIGQGGDKDLERKRTVEIHGTILAALPDYTLDFNLKHSFQKLIQEEMGVTVSTECIKDLAGTNFKGGSKDPVYHVLDETGHLILIAKAFFIPPAALSKFPAELSAMALILESCMDHVHASKPLAIGKCISNGTTYALLVETVAQGTRYSDAVNEIADYPLGSADRIKAFDIFKKGVIEAGAALGELQKISPAAIGPLSYEKLAKLEEKLDVFCDSPAAVLASKYIPQDELVDYIQYIKEQALAVQHELVYCHGDGHMGNYFYEPVSNTFTMIDLERMHNSIDFHGYPLGPKGFDYVRFLEDLEARAVDQLTQEELAELKSAFIDSFLNVAGELPPEELQKLYYAYQKLTRLNRAYKHIHEDDDREHWELVFHEMVKYFAQEMAINHCQ